MEVPARITAALPPLLMRQAFAFALVGLGPRAMVVAVRGGYALFLPLRTCRWPDKAALACDLSLDREPAAETALRAEAERRRVGYGAFPVVRQIWEIRGISKRGLIGYDMFGGGGGGPFVNVFVYVVDQLEYPKPAWKSGKVRLLEVVLGVRL